MAITVPTTENYRFNTSVELTVINCGRCGGTYAINERRRAQCQEEGNGWACPYCECKWGYYGTNENARLKKELERERKRKEWAEQEALRQREQRIAAEHRERAQKAAKTRIKNRVGHGVCPCCTRTFDNLARHMASKHPDYAVATD
ncbi:MAG: hypothetical protein HMLKMBBP_01528 [Planctomycetes bacterium]|nr:hypothetical protein [Planctomycetota bacterium]